MNTLKWIPYKTTWFISKAIKTFWFMEYECHLKRTKSLCFIAFVLLIAVFTVINAKGDVENYTHPLFVIKTILIIESTIVLTLWSLHKKDIQKYGYIRKTGQ
ncbi:hypothetical protein DER63_14175 [Salmonella enterica]|nr:hypothetical protein [Salmonella enterica]